MEETGLEKEAINMRNSKNLVKLYSLPTENDTEEQINLKKSGILATVVPGSIMPAASAAGFLIFGARPSPCFFPLKLYMVIAGALSLSIPVMGVVFKRMLDCMLSDKMINQAEAVILKLMEWVGMLAVVSELAIIIAGSVVIMPNLGKWQYDNEDETDTYCDFGLVMFSLSLLIICWTFILLEICFYVFIKFCDNDRRK